MEKVNAERGGVLLEASLVIPIIVAGLFTWSLLLLTQLEQNTMQSRLVTAVRHAMQQGQVSDKDLRQILVDEVISSNNGLLQASDIRICPLSNPSCTVQSVGKRAEFFIVKISSYSFFGLSIKCEAMGLNA